MPNCKASRFAGWVVRYRQRNRPIVREFPTTVLVPVSDEIMTPIGSTKFIERVRFFDNERLIAPDLQAIDDFARQMRWLHNRSLHQPGVASGYAVAGQKGDREVTIQPGYA